MNNKAKSRNQLLDASLLTAFASFILMIVGFLKNKVAAVLLGPIGFGQISLLQNLLTTASTLISVGTQNSVPRQIARNLGNDKLASRSVRSAIAIFLILSIAGLILGYLAALNLNKFDFFKNVSIDEFQFAFGIFLLILSGGLLSILNATGRIRESSIANVVGAAAGALIGVFFLWKLSTDGILLFLLAPALFVTTFCVIKLRHVFLAVKFKIEEIDLLEIKEAFSLGLSYLGAALIATLTQLAVRVLVSDRLGETNLGLVSAGLAISGSYMAVIVSSVGTNFFPRLSHAIHDKKKSGELIREQISICLSIGYWILLFCISVPSIVISLLFSREFSPAAHLTQYFVVADFFKVLSWIFSYAILAKGFGRLYFLNELFGSVIFILIIYYFLEKIGLNAVGWAAIARYAVGFLISYIYCRRQLNFEFGRRHAVSISSKATLLVIVMIGVSFQYAYIGYFGVLVAAAFSLGFIQKIWDRII